MFTEFKFEVDAYLRKELSEVRELAKTVVKMINEMKTWWAETKDKFSVQFYGHLTTH